MNCPKCGTDDWIYTDDEHQILDLGSNGYAIQIDFPCYCPYCECVFFRREVYVLSGKETEWIFDGEIIEESE